MAMNIDAGFLPSDGRAAKPAWLMSRLPWLGVVLLFVAAMAMRHVVAGNTDVSWLVIAGERWLDGQRLYSDIVETNPPMAVLIYIPGILIARALGIPAEIVLDGLVFAAIAVSLAITARILKNSSALAPSQRWPLALLAVMVLTILPVQVFGQREHIAVIALFPALGVARAADQAGDAAGMGDCDRGNRAGTGAFVQAAFRHPGAVLSRASPHCI